MPLLATRVPLQASDDPALPGLAVLCRPAELTAMLSPRLAPWLGPDAHLLDSRAYLRRLSPGKRCSVELELVVGDRKSTRLNSSHLVISYAVFCLKKKKKKRI